MAAGNRRCVLTTVAVEIALEHFVASEDIIKAMTHLQVRGKVSPSALRASDSEAQAEPAQHLESWVTAI